MATGALSVKSNRARILLADDHTMVAEGLQSLLKDEFDLVGLVGDGHALVEAARRLGPDVIVTDISMPRLNGLDAIRQLRRFRLPAKVVCLTMHANLHLATEAFRAGATGYVLKESAGEELVFAIHEVLRGRIYLGPQLAKDIVSVILDVKRKPKREVALTPRQREILQLVAEGRTMKELAGELGISRRTAESHKYQIMRQLGVQTSAQLIRYAVQIGLVPLSPAPRGDR